MISMTGIVSPKIDRDAVARNYGRFLISPLQSGYGVTLGNALRRVLLSSLEGVAATSIRVADTYHEFTDLPGIREDMTQIMLQIHRSGLGIGGVYVREVAETKVVTVHRLAEDRGYPLRSGVEEE